MFKKIRINSNLKLLREGDLRGKMMAAQYLGQVGEREMVGMFIDRLDNGYDQIRFESVCVLGEFKDPRAINPLIRVLADPNDNIRLYAAKALEKLGEYKWITFIYGDKGDFEQLGKCGDPRAFEPLARTLKTSAIYVRADVAQALGELGDTRAVPLLLTVLNDVDFNLRQSAAEALGKLGVNIDTVANALIRMLNDSNSKVRMASARSLGKLEVIQAKDHIRALLIELNNEIRLAGAQVMADLGEPDWQEWVKGDDQDFYRLAQSGNPQAIELLLFAVKLPNIGIRLSAAHAVVEYCEPDIIESLTQYIDLFSNDLENPDNNIRLVTVDILGRIGSKEIIPVLTSLLVDPEINIRKASATALHRLGETQWISCIKGDNQDIQRLLETQDQQIISAVVKIFPQLEEPIQKEAVESLGAISDPAAVDLLLAALEKFTGTYRVKVLNALAKQQEPRAAQPIINLLQQLNPKELMAAVEALGKIKNPEAIKPLISQLISPSAELRLAVANSLEQLGEPQWQQWIQGDNNDLHRLIQSNEPGIEKLVNRVIEPLKTTIKKGDFDSKIQAIIQLGQLSTQKAIAPLIRALRDSNPDIRNRAKEELINGAFEIRELSHQLINSLVREAPEAAGRKEAIDVIHSLGTEHFMEHLQDALKSSDTKVIVACAAVLKNIKEPNSVPFLIKILEHKYSDVLIAVSKALGQIGDTRAVDPLIDKLWDFREDVRSAVAEALGNLGDAKAIEPLIKRIAAPEANLRKVVAKALDKLGEPQWVSIINGNNGDFQRLGKSGDQRLLSVFLNALTSDNVEHRKLIAQGLVQLDDPKWGDCIRGTVDDYTRMGATKDPRVFDILVDVMLGGYISYTIEAAVNGLVKLGDTRAREHLIPLLEKKDLDIRLAGAAGLCELGDNRGYAPLFQALAYASSDSSAVGIRRKAAIALISLYRQGKLEKGYKEKLEKSRSTIRQQHSETVTHRSSDCSASWHTDNGGIGLDF